MGMSIDEVFDQYGNYKFPDYSNSQYTHNVIATGGEARMTIELINRLSLLNELNDKFQSIADINAVVIEQPTVEAIPKADYENRLKDDMVAMLEELKKEIEEIKPLEPTDDEDWQYGCFHGLELMQDKCLKLIQQKIDSLKKYK